jgi:hypothetical protein
MESIIAAIITAAGTIIASLIATAHKRRRHGKAPVQKASLSADGKHCPNCGGRISVLSIVTASSANRIKCRNCGSRLAYEGGRVINIIAILAGGILAIYLSQTETSVSGFILSFLLYGSLFDIFLVLYVRNERDLLLVRRGRS